MGMPRFINEPIGRLLNWWDTLPGIVQLVTWPLVFLISIFNLVVTIPEIICFSFFGRTPAEIQLLTREELVDWATKLETRYDSMIQINPPECLDVLEPPRDHVSELRKSLLATPVDYRRLKVRSEELASEYQDWKGEPPSQVYGLCRHVGRWCDDNDLG